MSTVTHLELVTVYAHGARIRRTATLAAGDVPPRVRLVGLPLAVIDDTLRVEIGGGAALCTSARVGLEAPVPEAAATEDSLELRGGKRRVALASAEVERISATLARLEAVSCIAEDPSDDRPASWSAIVAARRGLIALRADREHAARIALSAARRELDRANQALAAVTDRERRAGTERAARLHESRKHVELELVALAGAAVAPVAIHIEYLVGAARWAPSYVARLDGDGASLEIRAVVAQETGEDWTDVPLQLSTAEPARFALLPELATQRIGRRQADPPRAGFRAPPAGIETLYADYDREFVPLRRTRARPAKPPAEAPAAPPMAEQVASGPIESEVWDEETSAPKRAPTGRPMRALTPPPPQAAAPAPMMAFAPAAPKARSAGGGGGGAPPSPLPPPPPAPPPPQLDYGNLVMAAPSSPQRGRLVPASRSAVDMRAVDTAIGRIQLLAPPRGCATEWTHAYDFAYATEGAVAVRSDGAWHAVAVQRRPSTATLRHVAVPREQSDVFRIAALVNPFAGPLLPGPIDVYDRGRFLVTSAVEFTPPGANVTIGLGVDAAVKIARNTEFREEAAGMLRGALRLHHAIAIDVENVSGRAIDLEVRERIPVPQTGEEDVEIAVHEVRPPWDRYTPEPDGAGVPKLRGGYRWRVAVPPTQKLTLRASYEIKIPAKAELVGGNRREA